MFNGLNFSVYISEAEKQLPLIKGTLGKGQFVFTSFHIGEEVGESYCADATNLCKQLKDSGYRIIADVSKKTLGIFKADSLKQFAEKLGIDLLRIDYGFTDLELVAMAEEQSIIINCSTISESTAKRLGAARHKVYGLHNFYPRTDTGLDNELFERINNQMLAAGIEPMAFIAGDTLLRGPICDGLPTLEEHRGIPPYVAYLDMVLSYAVSGVFVGDGVISDKQYGMIEEYERTGVIVLPIKLDKYYDYLYDRFFTIRVDSPASAARFVESRDYATATPHLSIEPNGGGLRSKGCITIDNKNYLRYQGEIQLIRTELKADARVNVIGALSPEYHKLLTILKNGQSLKLVRN